MAQSVELLTTNPKVAGSNPAKCCKNPEFCYTSGCAEFTSSDSQARLLPRKYTERDVTNGSIGEAIDYQSNARRFVSLLRVKSNPQCLGFTATNEPAGAVVTSPSPRRDASR